MSLCKCFFLCKISKLKLNSPPHPPPSLFVFFIPKGSLCLDALERKTSTAL